MELTLNLNKTEFKMQKKKKERNPKQKALLKGLLKIRNAFIYKTVLEKSFFWPCHVACKISVP